MVRELAKGMNPLAVIRNQPLAQCIIDYEICLCCENHAKCVGFLLDFFLFSRVFGIIVAIESRNNKVLWRYSVTKLHFPMGRCCDILPSFAIRALIGSRSYAPPLRTMRQTLFYIPTELAGVPVFGFGLALALLLLVTAMAAVWRFVKTKKLDEDIFSYLGLAIVGGIVLGVIAPAVMEPQGFPIRGYGVW